MDANWLALAAAAIPGLVIAAFNLYEKSQQP